MSVASGWLNLAVYSTDFQPLNNPSVEIDITEALKGSSTGDGQSFTNAFGFQLNCYSPGNGQTGFQQFVEENPYGSQYENITFVTPNSNLYADVFTSGPTLPNPVPAGYTFIMAIHTDSTTKNTTGWTLMINDENGKLFDTVTMNVTSLSEVDSPYGPWQPSWAAPISALTLEIVGPGGTDTTYTSGAGTIKYIPSGGQSYASVAPVQTHYPFPTQLGINTSSATIHTSENSNMQYSEIAAYMQDFSCHSVDSGPITFSLRG